MKKINEKKSNSFTKNLRSIMHKQGITQMQLVDLFSKRGLKVPQSTISSWFSQGKLPHDDTFETLCKILHVKESDLIPDENHFPDLYNVITFEYPIRGKIACGEPTETFEDDGCTNVILGKKINADFALIAKGDSMIDFGIKDGYFVFIKEQKMVNNGEIAAVRIGNETTLKKFHFDNKKKIVTLVPGNPKYSPLVYTNEELKDITVLGKAVFFQGLIK